MTGGTLEMDYLDAKVTWRLQGEECRQVGRGLFIATEVDFLGLHLQLRFYPGASPFLQIESPAEKVEIKGPSKIALQDMKVIEQGSSNSWFTSFETDLEVVTIVIHIVKKDGVPMSEVLPKLLVSRMQKDAQRMEKETTARRVAEAEAKRMTAESSRLSALINAGSDQAALRACHLSRSAVKIQSKWRQVFTQQQLHQERSQRAKQLKDAARVYHKTHGAVKIQTKWRQVLARRRLQQELAQRKRVLKHVKIVAAITRLQFLWRLKQKRRERRWLRAQQGCSEAETPYDAILAFDSLAEFLKEGKIEFLQKAESQLEIAKESRYRIVAVVGLFDKGKTWLLNKLFGANLPAGKLCTTKGLSFLWIKERRMLVLDSAGVQSTVSYRAQAVDAIHDAQTTESLMFEMVSRISHHMVFVVNDLTWFEQKYVAMLHQKYVQCKQHKELIVVHNLRNTSHVAEATKLFKRQVMVCYDGEQSHLGRLIYTADPGEGVPPVHHIGLCHEFSQAGDEFNAKNREYLLQSLEHGNTLGSNICLTELLSGELSRLLPKFVNIETIEPEASGAASGEAVSVIFEDGKAVPRKAEDGSYVSSGAFRMRLSRDKARVTTKTRGVISPLGEIIAHDVSFDPIVNVFDKVIDTGVQRFIRIECPGVVEEEIEWQELANGVKVTINKKPPIEEHAVQPVEPIRQHHGVWEREFVFEHSEGRFDICEEEAALENGVLTMVLKKAVQPRKGCLGKARARRPEACERGQGVSHAPSDCSWDLAKSEVSMEAAGGKLAVA